MGQKRTSFLAAFVTTGDPTTVSDSTAQNELGTVITVVNDTGFAASPSPRVYQYVKLSAGTAAKGMFVVWSSYDGFEVDGATTITSALRNKGAGFLQSTSLATSSYGWVQVGGQGHVLIENLATVAVGEQIIQGATTNGRADRVGLGTAPTSGPYGVINSAKNAGSIGTDVVEALITPIHRHGW